MTTATTRVEMPDWAWQQAAVREALRARDMSAVLRAVQKYAGASQARIAAAVDMTQSRVNEIINGRREVSRLDVYERVADGLGMPDDARRLLGLAPSREARAGGVAFDLAAFPEVVRVYGSQAAAADEIQRHAATAAEIDVLAVRGLGLLALNDSLLRAGLTRREPPRVRVLLLDPDAPTVATRAAEIGESAESLAGGIRLSEARLRDLAPGRQLAVYRYRTLPTWRIIRLDSTMYLSAFTAGWEGHESAVYKVMSTPSGPLYAGFRRMLDALAEDAERTI
ncbi:putative transcriptional regulator [Actinacidiphila reveromycinica]|uniref:Putative transcriptional regulator n=1 Tax=Actinacidiphila reveromycinica TaxID=659352 RepID=A0A7U3UV37_9ACTN|nr:helix-turn-helix transcriptional regulator [Streptomyces sp. SN-593]BBA99296.1 putative transcriptional regulator [Streptomyces sp. SN-593]